jgi:radical SAM superfamily enzyme with C-terminal helix-hairpin-helix motif
MGEWLVIDGYEDEPAAFGVPNYIGFHVRYICGVLEEKRIPYNYQTIDQLRIDRKNGQLAPTGELDGVVILAGAVVPGKYVRGTPISRGELDLLLSEIPSSTPILCGGWAIRHWRYSGWSSLRENLFCTVQDPDATLNHYLETGKWENMRRDHLQWGKWAFHGSSSKAVTNHPDLISTDGSPGPLTYEVELYQGCVRFKRGCKFCIEPKKGAPIWREGTDVIREVTNALDAGVRNVRIGGATDIYSYKANGVESLDYPIPDPGPISDILYGLREDERLEILHVDNANPSIIAENIEPSKEITKTLVETLSDGAVLSFGLESADPRVHEENWLNCNSEQLISAVRMVNSLGRQRGPRGLPSILPGLNFIAGLNGETESTYSKNMDLLRRLRSEGLWLRRVNIRQVEGRGFQEIPKRLFKDFKKKVREEFDRPVLEEMLPVGTILRQVRWEAHNDRIRRPEQVIDPKYRDPEIHGSSGVTFGRQIGAYPILVGVRYRIPLETISDILVTEHGKRSVTGVEMGVDINRATAQQLAAIPGIGKKSAWNIVSTRARLGRSGSSKPFSSVGEAFLQSGVDIPEFADPILISK